MAYTLGREKVEDQERETRVFQERMIAAHPEQAKEIMSLFEEQDAELALPLSEEELENAGPRSMNEIEAALDALKELGVVVQDMD